MKSKENFCPLPPTLANFVGSVLTHSLNRVYLVQAMPSPKFLASLGTSDIPNPLCLRDMTYERSI